NKSSCDNSVVKRCGRCEKWLEIVAFSPNRSRRDGLQAYCSDCQRAYVREHYEKNRAYYLAKAKKAKTVFRARMKSFMAEFKALPCADCKGVFPPWVMDFDHVSGEKLVNVSRAVKQGRRQVLAEAAKCELVCANCHRDRTHRRLVPSRDSPA
ncbi:MAG TPA: hypothetical protein VFM96_01800, partial [Gaiellaceae bacterium]|nr:hypothetical protein [Gaiellaceae bacterium]